MEEGRKDEPQANQHRLTVAQAAGVLGITEGAVRSRIKRGTLLTIKEGGRVFVVLGGGTSQANQSPKAAEPTAQHGVVEELRDRVASLERQLERNERRIERQGDEAERLHEIIARLAQANAEQARTIRAIEAPEYEEVAEADETVDEAPETRPVTPSPQAPQRPQTGVQRPRSGGLRGLRRRILGW